MRFGNAVKGFGESVVGAVKGTSTYEPGLLGKAVDRLGSFIAAPFKGAAWTSGKIMKGGLKAGLYVAETPLVWATNSASWVVRKAGNFVHGNKGLSLGIAGVAGVIGVGSWLSRRAEARTQDEMMAQMAQIQSLQPVQATANSYAGLQPDEYDALVTPQLRGGDGVPRTDNAARLMAARQAAAAAQPAPNTQPTAAL